MKIGWYLTIAKLNIQLCSASDITANMTLLAFAANRHATVDQKATTPFADAPGSSN